MHCQREKMTSKFNKILRIRTGVQGFGIYFFGLSIKFSNFFSKRENFYLNEEKHILFLDQKEKSVPTKDNVSIEECKITNTKSNLVGI